MLELHVVNLNNKRNNYKTITIWKTNFSSINEFIDKLSSELWQSVFDNVNKDIDSIFNSFLNTYLQSFYSCFPKKSNKLTSNKQWITKGIINSWKQKKELYLLTRSNNDIQLKEYYMRYSKILSKVIKTAKTLHLNNQIKSFILIMKSRQHGTS
jgi:hypothetical protein